MIYTLFWEDGLKETIQGETIEDAFNRKDISLERFGDISFYTIGNKYKLYDWNSEYKKWVSNKGEKEKKRKEMNNHTEEIIKTIQDDESI